MSQILGLVQLIISEFTTWMYGITSTTNTLHRTIVNASPTISYSSYNHALEVNKSAVISPISFNCNSCDFEISPQLPTGMKFNITSGVINGTPTSVVANRSYSIKTTNISGVSTSTYGLKLLIKFLKSHLLLRLYHSLEDSRIKQTT